MPTPKTMETESSRTPPFLWLSVFLQGFEIVAYYKGWRFGLPNLQFQHPLAGKGLFGLLYSRWVLIWVDYLAPPLQFLTNTRFVLFLVQSLARLVICLVCLWIRLKKIKPSPKQGPIDLECGNGGFFPMVLVQIPMYSLGDGDNGNGFDFVVDNKRDERR